MPNAKAKRPPAAKVPRTSDGIEVHCAHTRLVATADLKPTPGNPNTHPEQQIEKLAHVIRHQGWRNPIVVSRRSGLITKGHARLQAAQLQNWQQVPVDDQHYKNAAAEKADLLADNKLAELAEFDMAIAAPMFSDIDSAGFDLTLTGFGLDELAWLGTGNGDGTDKWRDEGVDGALAARFGVPPFSVLNAGGGWWQDRKRAWIALGIQSELGRGAGVTGSATPGGG